MRLSKAFLVGVALLAAVAQGFPARQQQRPPQSQEPGEDDEAPRRRPNAKTVSLKLGGRDVLVRFNPLLSMDSTAYRKIADLKPGEVVRLDLSAAFRLRSDTDLVFGKRIVRTGNQAPNYPGVYSIWIRKAAAGWTLVFNSEGDIWGTQHNPLHDVAEVPLEWRALEAPASRLQVELDRVGDTRGRLRIAWGRNEWSAPFEVNH